MVNVPEKFRPHINVAYPEGNDLIFEEWFYHNFEEETTREYLPVFWTSFHVNNGYGRDRRLIKELQLFVNSIDKSKQYFTIIQYDSGPLVNLPPNIKVFAMSGPRIDYPLPLICKPHSYNWNNETRWLIASFVGRLTHPIRHKMVKALKGTPLVEIDTKIKSTSEYCKITAQSVFALCPRGFGETSFRICEALQYGAIPVYISDEFIIPHNHDFNDYGVLIDAKEVSRVHEILSQIPESEVRRKQEVGQKIYNEKFSFQGCKNLILDNI